MLLSHTSGKETDLLFQSIAKIIKYLESPTVTEIMLMSNGSVIVDDLKSGMKEIPEKFSENEKELISRTLAHLSEKTVYYDNKFSFAAILPHYKTRVQVIVPPVASRGIRINIRKFSETIIPLIDYLNNKLISVSTYNFLLDIVENQKNVIICGGTGSGKTTLLNALIDLIDDDCTRHLYFIEDQPEIKCSNVNATFIETSYHYTYQQALFDALRMRPDSIFFGEIRDAAAYDLMKAWNTGHSGGMSTLHANSAIEAIERIKQMSEEKVTVCDRQMICSAVDLIIYIRRQRVDNHTKFVIEQAIEPQSYGTLGLKYKEIKIK